MSLYDQLVERERSGTPISVGLVGAGQMGTGLVSQVAGMQGMNVTAIADIAIDRARAAFTAIGIPDEQIVEAHTTTTADEALHAGKRVITKQADLLPR